MKFKFYKFSFILATLILLFASCKKEEDNASKKNSFIYNEKESSIGEVIGESYISDNEQVFINNVMFLEKNFTVQYEVGQPIALLGKGDILIVYFLTNKKSDIPSGEYNLNPDPYFMQSYLFNKEQSALLVDYSNGELGADGILEFKGGIIKVLKIGDEYEFTFDINTTVHSKIKGYYKGKVKIYTYGKKSTFRNKNWPLTMSKPFYNSSNYQF